MERQRDPEQILKVARYLSAAYIACNDGMGMDYTRKKYVDHPIGKFWLDVAELVMEGMSMAHERLFPVKPPPTIQ